jgi:hypothetical protein
MGTSLLTVIASEAQQSIDPQRKNGLLRRFAPRNDDDTENTRLPDANASAIIEL